MKVKLKLRTIIILLVAVSSFILMLIFLSSHIIIPRVVRVSDDLVITRQSDINQLVTRFYMLKKQGSLDKAENLLTKALKVFPSNERLQKEIGYFLLERGDNREALKHFLALEEIDPKNELTQLQIAYIYDNLQDYSRAEKIFKKLALSENANIRKKAQKTLSLYMGNKNKKILNSYYMLKTRGKLRRAKKTLLEYLRRVPGDVSAQKEMGYLLLKQGDKKSALTRFLIADKIDSGDEHLKLQIAYLYIQLESADYRKKAWAILERLAAKSKNAEIKKLAKQAMARMKRL